MTNVTAMPIYRVVTVLKKPFVMHDNGTGEWYGYCIDLLNLIADKMKFNYTIKEVADKEYGYLNDSNQWNGMIRELMDKKADIGLGALEVMADRERVIDFTTPYYEMVGLTMMMRKTRTKESEENFLGILKSDVWYCILGAYLFTSFLMWIFDHFSPYSYRNNKEKYKDCIGKRKFSLTECLWFCVTSLTPQGGGEAPKNLSGRLVAATWWLFGFIIMASYMASLAARLTLSRLDVPIESLDQLASQYRVRYAVVQNSSAHTYFLRMAYIEDQFYRIWKDMSLNDSLTDLERSKLAVWDYPVSDKYTKMLQSMVSPLPGTMEDAVDRVLKRGQPNKTSEFALIGDANDIKYLTMTNCELKQVGEEFSRKPYAIAVQQGSLLKDRFNDEILLLMNKRKLENLKDKWWNKQPEKKDCGHDWDRNDGINMKNMRSAFNVIFVGIGLACIALILEYYRFYDCHYECRPKIHHEDSKRDENPADHKNSNGFQNPDHQLNSKDGVINSVKPIAFTLRRAPTQGLQFPDQCRSRFQSELGRK